MEFLRGSIMYLLIKTVMKRFEKYKTMPFFSLNVIYILTHDTFIIIILYELISTF